MPMDSPGAKGLIGLNLIVFVRICPYFSSVTGMTKAMEGDDDALEKVADE